MTKEFYKVLEISETATQEEIKKSYRKLSLKWHPDKWATKSEAERKQAEEKFKEINKAYQILSDPETRNMYDIYGEEFDNFGSSGATSSDAADEMKREYAEAEAQKQELKKQMLTVQMQSLSILLIIDEFMEYIWLDEGDLDSNLWNPCRNWKEKIRSLPFEEIDAFREKMISVIQAIGKRKKDEEKEEQSSNSIKKDAISRIEKKLKDEGVKAEELEPINRNYKEAINNSGETVDEILDIEERIERDINKKCRAKSGQDSSVGREEHVEGPTHEVPRFPKQGWWGWGKN